MLKLKDTFATMFQANKNKENLVTSECIKEETLMGQKQHTICLK